MTKPVDTCVRCGAPTGIDSEECSAQSEFAPTATEKLRCRERELANLRSLLRSVTGKLENAREHLDGPTDALQIFKAAAEVDAVLELLS